MVDDPDERAPGERLTRCPFCDADGTLVASERVEPLRVPYGPPCSFLANLETCSVCGESADFSGFNDARISKALKEATDASVDTMLEDLAQQGVRPTYIERVLNLPPGVIPRLAKVAPAYVAILRIVRTYPWITQVAEAGFDKVVGGGQDPDPRIAQLEATVAHLTRTNAELEAACTTYEGVIEVAKEDRDRFANEVEALNDELRKYQPSDAVELRLRAHYVLIDEAVQLFDAVRLHDARGGTPAAEDLERIAAWTQHPTVLDAMLQAKGYPPTGPGQMRRALDGLYDAIACAADLLRAAPLQAIANRREFDRSVSLWLANPIVVQVLQRCR